jgi:pilus assembly protein FimV
MRVEAIRHAGNAARIWMLSVAVLFVANANALGLGEIQANSNPGEMDKAQIALIPSVSTEQAENSQRPEGTKPKQPNSGSVAAPQPGETKPAVIKKPGVHSIKHSKQMSGVASPSLRLHSGQALSGSASRAAGKTSGDVGSEQNTMPFGKFPLLLSMKLSIPGNEPVRPGNSTKIGEALQPDSIAKEKTLSVLNTQITEMEQMIKAQQSQLDISTNPSYSRVAPSGVLAQSSAVGGLSGVSSVPGVGNEQPKPKIVAPVLRQTSKEENSRVELLKMSWIKPAIGLGLVLLAVPGFVWYRRYKTKQQWKRGSFHDLSDVHDPELVEPPVIVQTVLPVDEQTIKTPAYNEEKSQSILPPEYEMLEEADIYLRFGHDKLAEEVLREAIKINPKNPHAYLRLLRIYFAREDSIAFLAVAQHLKLLGDGMAWAKATEMGAQSGSE